MFYKVLFADENEYGAAYLSGEQKGNACFPPPGIFQLPYIGIVENWKRLTLEVREGEFADYLSNDLGCRLCSDHLRCILQLSKAAAVCHQVFSYPKAGAMKLFVAEPVKQAIDAASCTGLEFSPAPIQ